jgi:nuclear pore complex protein Nup50
LCVFVLYVDIKQPFLLPENELQQPGSPSVKKSVEKGIVTVHEVKCKLYVKVIDISYCTH